MKKITAVLLGLFLLLATVGCGGGKPQDNAQVTMTVAEVAAASASADDCFVFELFEDTEGVEHYEVIGTTETGKTQTLLVVPVTHSGVAVRSIAGEAFKDCTALKYVSIKENILTIGDSAFSGCSALETLVIEVAFVDGGAGGEDLTPQISSNMDQLPIFEYGMLNGAGANVKLYVPSDAFDTAMNDYFWGDYASIMEKIPD